MNPVISVIVPTYQHARSLPACLEAILAQTYPFLEIIVVDDGSTDGTEAVLINYRDRVKVIYQNNAGANPARNRGLAEAEGEFLIFCDADVIMKPQMIEKMHKALMNNPATSYAYSGVWFGWKHFPGQIINADRLRRMN